MRALTRYILGAVTLLSLLLLAAAVAIWVRSYRSRPSIHFSIRHTLWQITCERGRFQFTNAPQFELELEAVRARFLRDATEAYSRARDDYERSGRDLAINLTEPQQEARAAFESEVALANFLQMRFIEETESVQQRWRANPPVHRSLACGYPAAATSLLPCAWFLQASMAHARRLRRRKANLCERCGYDLRATPARCPECGNAGVRE